MSEPYGEPRRHRGGERAGRAASVLGGERLVEGDRAVCGGVDVEVRVVPAVVNVDQEPHDSDDYRGAVERASPAAPRDGLGRAARAPTTEAAHAPIPRVDQ